MKISKKFNITISDLKMSRFAKKSFVVGEPGCDPFNYRLIGIAGLPNNR
jgi:hypothetical protein